MDNWIKRFRNAKTAEGYDKVLIPGDPEREIELIRLKQGIPLVDAVIEDLEKIGKKWELQL
jgi:LDH2 family malate/lactate/ureidoglycolate dehydrogenase